MWLDILPWTLHLFDYNILFQWTLFTLIGQFTPVLALYFGVDVPSNFDITHSLTCCSIYIYGRICLEAISEVSSLRPCFMSIVSFCFAFCFGLFSIFGMSFTNVLCLALDSALLCILPALTRLFVLPYFPVLVWLAQSCCILPLKISNSSALSVSVGDYTPDTMSGNLRWQDRYGNRGLDMPRYSTPDYIYSMNPNTKFIVLLRDPVER